MKKKKVFVHTDFSLSKTGFARAIKALLIYLYKTGKYDILHFCCGIPYSNPVLQKTPWKSVGCLPDDPAEIDRINKDPNLARDANYGGYLIDKVIIEEKPDIYIGTQDIWAFTNYWDKYWWNKIPSVIWTTLDSLPLLPYAVENANKIKNYWIWSSFATKELHRLGHTHVKTLHGPLEDYYFYRLSSVKKQELRTKFNIPLDSFIIGFVFRNQLRKSVPNLLEGFQMFRKSNPQLKNCKLLLHTSYSEGWNINKLAAEYGVSQEDILTTYVCRVCNQYEVRNFTGEEQNCRCCGSQKSLFTTNVAKGVSEEQLNEVYNLMDVYCHPFTSGGQEIPIQEAKLAELITLVTNYSCGEELCEPGSGSLPLDWAEYREHGTEFRKASTLPSSICKQLTKVYQMEKDKRIQLGKQARDWTIANFSIAAIGKQFEQFIDSIEATNYDFIHVIEQKNPDAEIPAIVDNKEWLKKLYSDILKMHNMADTDQGLLYWQHQLKNGMTRKTIEDYFRVEAQKENLKNQKPKELSEFLDETGNKRVLLVLKESIGDIFLSTSLLKSIKEQYPNHDIYFACEPQYFEILDGNPYIYKCLTYLPQMESEILMTGAGKHKGYFDVYINLALATQKQLNYLTHDKIALNLS